MSTSAISIIVDDNDVTELCTSFEVYEEMESLIGNSVSTQVKISLINKDNLLANLLDYPFIINNKSYLVYSKPERWTKEISLTLYDLMIEMNVRYKTALTYPCTIEDQLVEMSSLTGIYINAETLSPGVLSKVVGWYDETILIREYLGWIAECDGKNAFIEDDQVVFKAVAQSSHETDFCSDFEKIETISFSRVCFDDGVIESLASGDDSGRTLYLNENNSYIDSNDVIRIYNMYRGLTITTIKSFDCFSLPDFKLTDLIIYDDMVILPIVQKVTINGGEADDSVSFSCELKSKNADNVILKDSSKARIRRVQTQVSQLEGKYSVVAKDVEDSKGKIAELTLNAEKFEVTVTKVEELEKEVDLLESSEEIIKSDIFPEDTTKLWLDTSVEPNVLKHYDGTQWVLTNDQSREIQEAVDEAKATVTNEYTTSLQLAKDQLSLAVNELERVIDSNTENITSIQTTLDITSELAQFTKTTLEQVQSALDGKVSLNEIIEWARFDGAKLELGTSDSVFKAILTNTELGFYEGDVKVAWVSNNEFHARVLRAEEEISVNELSLQFIAGIGYVLK